MKRPLVVVLIFSLAANLACVAALVWRSTEVGSWPAADTSIAKPAAGGSTTANASEKAAVEAAPPGRRVRADTWEVIGTGDLSTLVANLRAAGFPPNLVRAIVGTMVNESFAARRRALRGNEENPPFWKPRTGGPFDLSKQADVRALYREQQDMMKSLLGEDVASDEMRQMQRRMFGPVPDDKIDLISRINSDYQELSMKVQQEANGFLLPWDREQLAMIEREKRTDLAAVLSPDELEMFDLYSSSTASLLRSRMASFNPTEQEFRDVYKLQSVYDERYNPRYGVGAIDQAAAQERQAATRQLNDQIKAVLGDARYAEYERAQDYSFRAASRITERLNLPAENAVAVYDLQKTTQQQMDRIRAARDQTAEARNAALAALAREANQRVVTLLGAQGAEAYVQSGGSWLRSIERSGPVVRRTTTITSPGGAPVMITPPGG